MITREMVKNGFELKKNLNRNCICRMYWNML